MTNTTASIAPGNAFTDTPSDKRIEILQLLGKRGSTSQAARDPGVSYQAAWQAINTLSNLAGVALVERMGLRTRMRKQLPCFVDKLETRGQVVRMYLRLAAGAALAARITKARAERLGQKKNLKVLALCKATAVSVMADSPTRTDENSTAQQALHGRAIRISRGAAGASGIKPGKAMSALLDKSAIVIALAN